MPRALLAFPLVLALAGAGVAAGEPAAEPTLSSALARAAAERKPVLVDFFTDW